MSFQSYQAYARNSNRASVIKDIETGLEIFLTKTGTYPLPSHSISILSSGSIIASQWYFWDDATRSLKMNQIPLDPLSQTQFTYTVNVLKSKYQWFLLFESTSITSNLSTPVYAEDNTPYVEHFFWDQIGVVFDQNNIPIQQSSSTGVDITSTASTLRAAYSPTYSTKGSGELNILVGTMLSGIQTSCLKYSQLLPDTFKKNGVFLINPTSNEIFKTYCDMEHGSGWWTLLFSVNPAGTTWTSDSTMWTNPVYTSDTVLSTSSGIIDHEVTTKAYGSLKGNEIRICRGDLTSCYVMTPNAQRTLKSYYDTNQSYVEFSRCDKADSSCDNNALPKDVWVDRTKEFFQSLWITYNNILPKHWIWINIFIYNKLWYQWDNNNIWPSFDNDWTWIWVTRARNCLFSGTVENGSYNPSRERSVEVLPTCAYVTPDTKYWYVFIR